MPIVVLAATVAGAAAGLASCSAGAPESAPPTTAGGPAPTTPTSTTHTGTTGAHRIVTKPTTPRSGTAGTTVAGGPLVGIGATVAQFAAAHGVIGATARSDSCSASSHCFGIPVVNDESGSTYQFTDAVAKGGLIIAYNQNFPTRTTVAQAEQQVLKYLPGDAKATSLTLDTIGGTCAVYNITSATLGAALSEHPAIADPFGAVGVELSYTDPSAHVTYDPNNVQDAFVSIGVLGPSSVC